MNPSALTKKYYLYNCLAAVKSVNLELVSTSIFSYVSRAYSGFRFSYHYNNSTCDLDAACRLLKMYNIPFVLEYRPSPNANRECWLIEIQKDIAEYNRAYRLLTSLAVK